MRSKSSWRVRALCAAVACVFLTGSAGEALAKETIYIDTASIDGRSDLDDTKKAALKQKIINDVKANYESALGAGNVEVTNDPTKKAGASRTVDIKAGRSPVTADGDHYYGSWPQGNAKGVTVYLGEFLDDPGVAGDFKTGGAWDTNKLGNAIGHTVAHEVGHSYSVGHNTNEGAAINKMTDGGKYGASEKATHNWQFDEHSKKTIKANAGKTCRTAPDYEKKVLVPHYCSEPDLPNKTCDVDSVDALFDFDGVLADQFDFGFLGADSDLGLEDGNSDFDFIFKSSMEGLGSDAELISFFIDHHSQAQFLLQGAEGSAYAGQWFLLPEGNLTLSDWVEGAAKLVSMEWDIDDDLTMDVSVTLNTRDVFGAATSPCNGFTYEKVPEPMSLIFLAAGGLAALRRRRVA